MTNEHGKASPGIDDVLERVVDDPAFAQAVATDPATALEGYHLSADDLDLLASQLTTSAGGSGRVERRTSKAGLVGLLTSLAEPGVDLNPDPDTDGDGLSDSQELFFGSDPKKADSDWDGLSDAQEMAYKTDPNVADTDGDGISDNSEVNIYGTDPTDWDTDGDGISDEAEINIWNTDPTKADADGDGLTDKQELALGTNPNDADSDHDGLTDKEEKILKTNPLNPDTDGDGFEDGLEADWGNPFDPKVGPQGEHFTDTDGDGLKDAGQHEHKQWVFDMDEDGLNLDMEKQFGTDAGEWDTDGDGISDGQEVYTYGTSPTDTDTDGDGWWDKVELGHGSDPLDPNSVPDNSTFISVDANLDEPEPDADADPDGDSAEPAPPPPPPDDGNAGDQPAERVAAEEAPARSAAEDIPAPTDDDLPEGGVGPSPFDPELVETAPPVPGPGPGPEVEAEPIAGPVVGGGAGPDPTPITPITPDAVDSVARAATEQEA